MDGDGTAGGEGDANTAEDEVAKSLWRGRVSKAAEKAFRACDSAASEWAMSANEEIELYCVQEPAESFSKHK